MNTLFLNLSILLCRVLLGAYMLMAGLSKIRGGVADFVAGGYAKNTPAWLPSFIATPYGYAIPWIELVGGALIVLGLFHRGANLVTAAVLLSIAIALNFQGPSGPFHHSVIMFGLAVLLAAVGPGPWSIDALWGKKKRSTER